MAICLGAWLAAGWGALMVGPDEGMEMAKAMLLHRHPELAPAAWNDQPWLFSRLIAQCGAEVVAGRVLVAAISLGGLLALGCLAARMHPGADWLAPGLMLLWPKTPELSTSVMMEWPAWCVGLVAAALLPGRNGRWHRGRLALAGAVFAVAVSLKFTVLLLAPALAAAWLAALWGRNAGNDSQRAGLAWVAGSAGMLAAGFVSACAVIWMTGPAHDWTVMWASHAGAGMRPEALAHRFDPLALLGNSPGTVLAAALGIAVLARRGAWGSLLLPVSLLLTAFMVHAFHRPFWYYYELHFGIPLSLLGAAGLAGVFRAYFAAGQAAPATGRGPEAWMLLGTLSLAMILAKELPRHWSEVRTLTWTAKAQESALVSAAGRYAARSSWAYAQTSELFYHVGVPQPPELVVVPAKRFWNGSLDEDRIVNLVRERDCEMLLLREERELKHPRWQGLVSQNYLPIYSDRFQTLFVHRRLNPVKVEQSGDWRKRLGLEAAP